MFLFCFTESRSGVGKAIASPLGRGSTHRLQYGIVVVSKSDLKIGRQITHMIRSTVADDGRTIWTCDHHKCDRLRVPHQCCDRPSHTLVALTAPMLLRRGKSRMQLWRAPRSLLAHPSLFTRKQHNIIEQVVR
jgi:hypothetical protein